MSICAFHGGIWALIGCVKELLDVVRYGYKGRAKRENKLNGTIKKRLSVNYFCMMVH